MSLLANLFGFGASLYKRTSVSGESEASIKTDWEKINGLLKAKGPSNFRQALITADRSFDTALKDVSNGETMGERLKNVKERFDRYTYNDIWEAHKLRNSLVHEAGFEPPYFVVEKAIGDLKKALEVLGVTV